MDFVGPPATWSFNRIENARGCETANSVVTEGQNAYYIAEDGWVKFDGQRVTPIGAQRFDRFFANASDAPTRDLMSVFVDPNNTLIIWAFNGFQNANDINDTALIYDYVLEEASLALFDCSLLGNFISPGFTVEELDGLSSSIDALVTPLDDNFYKAGAPIFGALQTGKLFTFTGAPLPATIDTSETRLGGDKRARVLTVSQAVEGQGDIVTVQLGTRNRTGVPVKFGPARPLNVDGRYNERLDSRYQRFRANITGDWSDATGLFVRSTPTSYR